MRTALTTAPLRAQHSFGLHPVCVVQAETMKVIDECNGHWQNLVDGKTDAGKMWIKK